MVSVSFAVGDHLRYCTSVKDPFVRLFVMSCGTLFFLFRSGLFFHCGKVAQNGKEAEQTPERN